MGGLSNDSVSSRIARILTDAAEQLASIGAGNPRFEAELLLAQALDKPRVYLFAHPRAELTPAENSRFLALLERRLESVPIQYVMGSAQFRDLELNVAPGVLIPRPETELLVDYAWQALERRREKLQGGDSSMPGPWLIDVGVGSGAILLSMMQEERKRCGSSEGSWFQPLGIDLLPTPLTSTGNNAGKARLPRPALMRSDFLSAVTTDAPIAGILSNPPYVSASEMEALPVEIYEYEPHEALFGGVDGMSAIRILLDQAAPYFQQGAFFCCEIGGAQAELVREALDERNLWKWSQILPDLAGKPRVVLIEPDRDPLLP
jgi:release factor glutamine methyltransferase